MKAIIGVSIFLLFHSTFYGQSGRIDSLETRLMQMKEDSGRVNFLNEMVVKYQHMNPARAMELAVESATLARRIRFDFGLGAAYRLTGILYVDKSDFDKGTEYYNLSLGLFRDSNDLRSRRYKGMLQHNLGVISHYKGQYDSAVIRYQEAARIYRELKEDGLLFLSYNNLSTLYSQLRDNENALKYASSCVEISNRLGDPYKISVASLAMTSAKAELKDYKGIDTLISKILSISEKNGNFYMLGMGYKMLGKYQIEYLHDEQASVASLRSALDNMTKAGNEYEITAANQNLAYSYFLIKNDEQAVHFFTIALEQARKQKILQIEQYVLQNLSDLEARRKNFPKAYEYLKSFLVVKDSVIANTHQENIQSLEAKYQSEIKDGRIAQLADEKKIQALTIRQKSTLNYFLAAFAAALLVVVFLGYRNIRHRQQLAKQQDQLRQQQIRELEKDKQLVAVDSLLKGQEEERSRLAKDLHDGLGGLLSGVKFSISNMKDNLLVTPDNMTVFERSLDMIDTAIKELRRVAHNMMPEMLAKFGLDEAVKEYCNTVNNTKMLEVKYQSVGLDRRMEKGTEIIVYRIVQELLNNVLKHAMAGSAFVQLVRENDRFSIVVEDNGRGFDTSLLGSSMTAGWVNIRSRVEYLRGKVDVHSEPGKGTLVNIEFKIQS